MSTINKNVVTFQKNDDGDFITVSDNNPKFGFIVVQQDSIKIGGRLNRFANEKAISMLLNGSIPTLEKILADNPKGISANIIIEEYLESEIPTELLAEYTNERLLERGLVKENATPAQIDKVRNELLDKQFKRTGNTETDVLCTLNGERIFVYKWLDEEGSGKSIHVQHDNTKETKQAWLGKEGAEKSVSLTFEQRKANAEIARKSRLQPTT